VSGTASRILAHRRRLAEAARRPSPRSIGIGLALLGAIGFAAKGVIVKLAYQHGTDSVTMVALRMLFALPPFLVLTAWSSARGPKLTARDWLDVVTLGFFGGYLTGLLDFAGLTFISAGLERLIVYLTPTLVLAIEALASRRQVRMAEWMAVGVSYLGAALVLNAESSRPIGETFPGAALVFGSACTYAIYLVRSGQVVRRLGALRLTGLATSAAAILCVAHFLASRPVSALDVPAPVIWLSFLNGTLCTFAPVVLIMLAIERIGAPLASQCGMVGPLATVALGHVFLEEPLTWLLGAGTILVLAGIWLLARRPSLKDGAEGAVAMSNTWETQNAVRTDQPV